MTDGQPDKRARTLQLFAALLGLPPLAGLRQRGRDPETAKFTIDLQDGRSVRVGTIRTLRSQTELASVLAVAIDCWPPPVERKDWHAAISALMTHAKAVDEAPGETFAETAAEWLNSYADQATNDPAGAARHGAPFRDPAGNLHVTASSFARYVRREFSEQVKLAELRQALADLGADRCNINYDGPAGRRSSKSYYRLPAEHADA